MWETGDLGGRVRNAKQRCVIRCNMGYVTTMSIIWEKSDGTYLISYVVMILELDPSHIKRVDARLRVARCRQPGPFTWQASALPLGQW
jgi:hypothetical protein